MTYRVLQATRKDREPEIKGSKFYLYELRLAGQDEKVELLQKPETPAPQVGDSIEGTIEPGRDKDDGTKWPPRLKRTSQGGFKPRSPQETASIVRQHSQHMAIAWTTLLAQHPGDTKFEVSLDDLRTLIDWFDADVASVKVDVPSKAPVEPPKPQREAAPTIPLDRAKSILEKAVGANLARHGGPDEGPLYQATLVAKLTEVGCLTGKLGHLNVDQAEEVEAWIAKEGTDAPGTAS